MERRRKLRSLSCGLAVALVPLLLAAGSSPAIEVQAAQASLDFPNSVTFSIQAKADSPIVTAEVEYGLETAACSTTVNLATPEDFVPGVQVSASWTWDMRQSGSLPPGAQLWWRWHLVDSQGTEIRTPTQPLTWLDSIHNWQTIQKGNLNLHWYSGSPSFAGQLLDAGVAAAGRLEAELGTLPSQPVNLYIYDSTQAMRDAILFEPSWSGGMAFPEHRTIILGISESDLSWGLGAVAHELAHVFVGNLVSACYSDLPTWLSEGLAMVAEGGLDAESQRLFDEALAGDKLFRVRALNDSFTEDSGRASLSYAQAYSLVDYLLKTYGQPKMLDLLAAAQAGYRPDHALSSVYGFDLDGLEQKWRAAIGAAALPASSEGATPTPTVVPTYALLAQPPAAVTLTPLPEVTQPARVGGSAGGIQLSAFLIGLCVAAVLAALVVLVIVLLLARRKRPSAAGGPGHD